MSAATQVVPERIPVPGDPDGPKPQHLSYIQLRIQNVRKAFLPLYRFISLIILLVVLASVIGYGSACFYYIAGSSWILPTFMNASDDRVLTLTGQLTSSEQAQNTNQLALDQSTQLLALYTDQKGKLLQTYNELNSAIRSQKSIWSESAQQLAGLQNEKSAHNETLRADISHAKELRRIVDADLKAGLIPKGDAQQQIIQIDQFLASVTDQQVTETLMTDSVRQHQMTDIGAAATITQKVEIQNQLALIDTQILGARSAISTAKENLKVLHEAITTAKNSPYYEAVNNPTDKLSLALAPYPNFNKPSAEVGDPVYYCYLGVVACRKAGTVTKVYMNEVTFQHPILRYNMRMYVMKISVDARAMKSTTLVVGRKPFLF